MPEDRKEEAKRTAIALYQEGVKAQTLGQYKKADECYKRCHTIMKAIGDQNGEAAALHYLGTLSESNQDWEAAKQYYEESFKLFEQDQDHQNCLFSLFFQSILHLKEKSYMRGTELLVDALKLSFELGPPFVQEGWSRLRQMSGVLFAMREVDCLIAIGERLETMCKSLQTEVDHFSPVMIKLIELTGQLGVFLMGCGRLWKPPEGKDFPVDEFIKWLLQTAVDIDQATGTGLAFTDLAAKVIQELG